MANGRSNLHGAHKMGISSKALAVPSDQTFLISLLHMSDKDMRLFMKWTASKCEESNTIFHGIRTWGEKGRETFNLIFQ